MTEPAKGLTKEEREELEEAYRQFSAHISAQEHKLHSEAESAADAMFVVPRGDVKSLDPKELRAQYEELLEKEFGSVKAGLKAMKQEGRRIKADAKAMRKPLRDIRKGRRAAAKIAPPVNITGAVPSMSEIMDKNEDLLPKDESTDLDKE